MKRDLLLTVLGMAVGALVVLRRDAAAAVPPMSVEAPVAVTIVPLTVGRWPRFKAAIRRFVKVFAFVGLGLVAASLTTPAGLAAMLEPQNAIVLVIASLVGALLKWATWTDVTAEVAPTVTLAITPKAPIVEGVDK